MNPEINQNQLPDDDQLEQMLMELHYELLDDDEADRLRRRIEQEPKVAAAWANTLVMVDKLAEAAKVDASEATVNSVGSLLENSTADVQSGGIKHSGAKETTGRHASRFLVRWLGSLATAAALVIVVSGMRYWQRMPVPPAEKLHVSVAPVAGAETKARNEFLVMVRPREDVGSAIPIRIGQPFDPSVVGFVPATISYQVLSKGVVLFTGTVETSSSEPARVRVPDEIAIPGGAELLIDAETAGDGNSIRLKVPLEPTRCLTFLSTDRPVYRPGETVFFRSVTLNRRTLESHLEVPIRYELRDPSGAKYPGVMLEGVTERGVGNGTIQLPEDIAGGTYQLVAHSLDGFFPDQGIDLEVRRYRSVRLKTQLEFEKRSFSAGQRLSAELLVRRADDSIPSGASARITGVVDGKTIYQSAGMIGVNGELAIEFDLPKVIRIGEGTLSVVIDDGSVTETAVRPIPIHTGSADVEFFPEGGYLVGGIENRIYFSARNPQGEPIEIAGEVLSQAGRVVATVQTIRDGLGRFTFKPESGQRYSLRITSPLDITETPWLPAVVEAMPVLDTGEGVFDPGDPITLSIHSTKKRSCLIRVVCRGELVGIQNVQLNLGENPFSVPIQDRASGVLRVTVLDTQGPVAKPLVERLVYRKGEKQLKITASVDSGQRVQRPGESVRMTVTVTDEFDRPVPGAVLGVSVVDDTALSLKTHQTPSIRTHFLLTSEIKSPEDLEHANIYLDGTDEADLALDLLLGTQGWRRFVSGTPGVNQESFQDALTRLLELDGKRSGLIGEPQSNDQTIAAAFADYRRHMTRAWQQFLGEVRFALIVVGVIWLVGFVLRPKRSTLAATGILLLLATMAAQLGCSGSHTSNDRGELATAVYSSEAEAADEQSGQGQESPSDELSHGFGSEIPQPGPETSSDQEQPFVQRVVQTFLGQRRHEVTSTGESRTITAEQLRRWAASRGKSAEEVAAELMEELRFPIRQYAHLHRRAEEGLRSDFTETLFWNPAMVTDSTGTVSIRFDLSDALTLFRVNIDGHSREGRLGSGTGAVVSKLPISVQPKMPLEVTAGDRIDLPVGLVNESTSDLGVQLRAESSDLFSVDQNVRSTSLPKGQRTTEVFSMQVEQLTKPATAELTFVAIPDGDLAADKVQRSIQIVPDGFPFTSSSSGAVSKSTTVSADLPKGIVAGSLQGTLTLYPSTRSQLSAGLESMLREPHGCFEQASSSNYPNVMALGLLELEGAVDGRTKKRTLSLLRRGYRKLTSYECSALGYEWFGNDPGHEALSAFGLMQFAEMSKYIDVDSEMMQRTRQWLLSRRDGKGGFQRNPRHLHAWSVEQNVVNAYVLWALSQADAAAGESSKTLAQIHPEIDTLYSVAVASDDPYLIALSAITLANVGRSDSSSELLDQLRSYQHENGSLDGQTTITQSGGVSRTVETTSLAILAWATNQRYHGEARRAANWLVKNRRGGGFGSTQATVLALKAMMVMHRQLMTPTEGRARLLIDQMPVHQMTWQGSPTEGIEWTLPTEVVDRITAEREAEIQIETDADSVVPYCLELNGQTITPRSDAGCPIDLQLSYSQKGSLATLSSGDTIDVIANVSNKTDQGQPMTVAVVGIPGGLEPVVESLDQLKDSGRVDYYELRGREVILYWRSFAPDQSRQIPITCVAEIGGRYTGPPSRAYLYYTAESKTWKDPLVAEIK